MKKLVKVLVLVLLCAVAFTLTACAPKDGAAAKEKLEENYTVVVTNGAEEDDYECIVTAVSIKLGGGLKADGLIATLYKTNAAAKEAYDEASTDSEGQKYDNIVKIGKWVVIGTEEAIEAFKK